MTKPPREPLTGYMILEDYTEDYSNWSGYITYPDPTGSNLAWEKPIKMIEHSAFAALSQECERLRNALHGISRVIVRPQSMTEAETMLFNIEQTIDEALTRKDG